jgi:hypothetical protein
MKDLTEKRDIPPISPGKEMESMITLSDGKQILLTSEEGGRVVQVQMVNG